MDHFFLEPHRASAVHRHILGLTGGGILPASAAGLPSTLPTALHDKMRAMEDCPFEYELCDDTAIIQVRGALASCQMGGWYCFAATTYESLVATVEEAVQNSSVARILLHVNSPGGTVLGCAEAAQRLDQLANQKPLWVQAAQADSAAYWLASAANRIIVDPTGEVGSIGVIMSHWDFSKALENFGIKITDIFAGSHKADGSPWSPLSDDALKRFQGDCQYLRGLFVDAVATYRQMDADTVSKTEALTYIGKNAVSAGLADDCSFLRETLNAFQAAFPSGPVMASAAKPLGKKTSHTPPPRKTQQKETMMGKKNPVALAEQEKLKNPKASAEDTTQESGDDVGEDTDEEADPADPDESETTTDAAENADGENADGEEDKNCDDAPAASAEKKRIGAILSCKEADGRRQLAQTLALDTNLSVEAARKILASSPAAQAAAGNPLASAMRKVGSPAVGVDSIEAKASDNPLLASVEKYRPKRLKK